MSDPNILLIHTDAQVHSFLGCAGHRVLRTPHLDRLASESTRFTSAYACSGICVPSRASLMTGRYPIAHGVTRNEHEMPRSEVTMGQLFSEAGYTTGYFGKTHYGKSEEDVRGDGWQTTFFKSDYNEYLRDQNIDARYPERSEIRNTGVRYWNIGTSRIPAAHYFENVLADRATDFIRDAASNAAQPFFCFVSNIAPHGPFTPPVPYDTMYDPSKIELAPRDPHELAKKPAEFVRWAKQNQKYVNDDELRIYLSHLYGLISLVDDAVGRIVASLKETGVYEKTIIVFTSDHGDFVSTYGILGKSWCMDDCLLRIPLIVKIPGCEAQVSNMLVENIDVLPTLLDAANIPQPARMQGKSFLPAMERKANHTKEAVFAYNEFSNGEQTLRQSSVRQGDWKYIHANTGHHQLYDLKHDPQEVFNLAGESEQEQRICEMKDSVLHWHVEYSGGYFAEEKADIWEKRVNFYDTARFTGG